jgi:hypothetical protein
LVLIEISLATKVAVGLALWDTEINLLGQADPLRPTLEARRARTASALLRFDDDQSRARLQSAKQIRPRSHSLTDILLGGDKGNQFSNQIRTKQRKATA